MKHQMRAVVQTIENRMFVRRIVRPDPAFDLCYIHGLGESGLCFEKIIQRPELSAWSHHVPDLPGYGRSIWPAVPVSLMEYARLYDEWITANNFNSIVLIGHSMGGVVGLMLAELSGNNIAGFINIDGNISSEDCHFSARVAGQSEHEFLSSNWEALKAQIYASGMKSKALRGYYASLCFADPRQYYLNSGELVSGSREEKFARRMAHLPMKTCYIAGRPGGVCAHSLELLHAENIDVVEIRDSGHWPFIDHESAFCNAVQRFVNKLRRC